jgi:5-dehydro-2-deoxygluconokinase
MISTTKVYDLLAMGRSSIDLYSNDIGVPFEEIGSFAAYVGGSPTNIAVGACRLGLRTALLTAVGTDPIGDFILHFLEEEGVETGFIPRKPESRSSAVLLGIEPDGKVPLVFYRSDAADNQLTIDDAMASPLTNCRIFEFAGTNLSVDPIRGATIYAAEQAKSHAAQVFIDLDLRADQWHDLRAYGAAIRSVLPLVDVAIGTEEEVLAAMLKDLKQLSVEGSQMTAPEVTGDLQSAIQGLMLRGPQVLVVKRGAAGCSIYIQDGTVIDAPGFPVEVFNVLGAGDAFASGFIYGNLKGWDLYRSARLGNACGAIVATRHGCANHMAYEQEALQFIDQRGGF